MSEATNTVRINKLNIKKPKLDLTFILFITVLTIILVLTKPWSEYTEIKNNSMFVRVKVRIFNFCKKCWLAIIVNFKSWTHYIIINLILRIVEIKDLRTYWFFILYKLGSFFLFVFISKFSNVAMNGLLLTNNMNHF